MRPAMTMAKAETIHAGGGEREGRPAGRRHWLAVALGLAALLAGPVAARAGDIYVPVYVPNASFELPVVTYDEIALPSIISWETFPQPSDEAVGVFVNNPIYVNSVPDDYIYNCDGSQAAFLVNSVGLAIFQDYDAVDSTGAASHAFAATYQVASYYQLVTGFIVSTNFGAVPGSTVQMSLYYRDGSDNMVTFASTNIVYDPNVFTGVTNLVDCELDSITVRATDPWAGRHIGIQFLCTASPGGQGYWDLDNVRLTEVLTPALVHPRMSNGQFQATLKSEPGLVFQILATSDLTLPLANWASVATLTNTTGSIAFVDSTPGQGPRYYMALQVP